MIDHDLIKLPYRNDCMEATARLLELPYPVLLDSCAHSRTGGRYDILSAMPVATARVEAGRLLCSESLPVEAGKDIFSAAGFLLSTFTSAESGGSATESSMPFSGGLLGQVGYPLVSGAGQWSIQDAFIGVYPWALVMDHQRRECRLYFQPWCPAETRCTVLAALETEGTSSINFNLLKSFSKDMSEMQYRQAFGQIKQYIDAGDCYQVNLTQRFSSRYEGHPFAAYQRLRNTTGKPFSAFLGWEGGALLSLSPERFLQVEGRHVVTQPIKGTRPRGLDKTEDQRLATELLNSEKDRAENLMIVDLLRNDIGAVCEYGSVRVRQLFELQQFDNVQHLVSTIEGTLRPGTTPIELLQGCFPGGSITGAPKLRAMEIIEELEPQQRGPYCGSVFYMDVSGRMDSNITIRSLLCQGDDILCWAGGGIVADSECDLEYAECFDKINSLIKTLQERC